MSLDWKEGWRYFSDDSEDDAVDEVLERLDPLEPDPNRVARALRAAATFLDRATGRFFRRRDGSITLNGTDSPRLWLPFPIVTVDQVEDAVDLAVSIDGTALDSDQVGANSGVILGVEDPRANPWIELTRSSTGSPFSFGRLAVFPEGVRNVEITASWGYLEEDGTTPEPILDCLARLIAMKLASTPDQAGSGPAAAALLSESVEGRTYTYAADAASYGLTLDRETDAILVAYSRPPEVVVSRGKNRGQRSIGFVDPWE